MPSKKFLIDEDLEITVYKNKKNKNLRLSMSATGDVRVSIPSWAPYNSGAIFAKSKYDWIKAHKKDRTILVDGQAIGKAHHIYFAPVTDAIKPASRVNTTEIIIKYPDTQQVSDSDIQLLAHKASIKALRAQAEALLPQRLNTLSATHQISYNSVSIRQLKGRWGSCDQAKNITLNLFLMQLPWEYIDYVLLHELTHTKILQHGPLFWAEMAKIIPNAKQVSKQLRDHQPILVSPSNSSVA